MTFDVSSLPSSEFSECTMLYFCSVFLCYQHYSRYCTRHLRLKAIYRTSTQRTLLCLSVLVWLCPEAFQINKGVLVQCVTYWNDSHRIFTLLKLYCLTKRFQNAFVCTVAEARFHDPSFDLWTHFLCNNLNYHADSERCDIICVNGY